MSAVCCGRATLSLATALSLRTSTGRLTITMRCAAEINPLPHAHGSPIHPSSAPGLLRHFYAVRANQAACPVLARWRQYWPVADFLMAIVVGVAVVLAVLGVQQGWVAWTDRSSRPRLRAAEAGFRQAGHVQAVGSAQEGALATAEEPQPPAADAPPLIVAERADPQGRSLVAVGPGGSSPTVGSRGASGHPVLTESPGGPPSDRSPDELIRQISARRAEKEALASGSPAWQAADLDERNLVEALAGAVGQNVTPDGLEWLIRRQRPAVATVAPSPTPPTPTPPTPTHRGPDALHADSSPPRRRPSSRR